MFFSLQVTNFFSMGEDLLYKWINTLNSFWNWTITYEFDVLGTTWYAWEVLFGSLLTLYASWVIIKFILDIAP